MTTKIHADTGIEFPDGSVQSSAAYSKAESDGPAFSAYCTNAQTITAAESKINFNAVDFDTANRFNSSLSRFQPNVAGYYQIICQLQTTGTSTGRSSRLYKNGIFCNQLGFYNSNVDNAAFGGCAIVYLNGSTDYVEIFAVSSNNTDIVINRINTYFQGFLARRA